MIMLKNEEWDKLEKQGIPLMLKDFISEVIKQVDKIEKEMKK